MGRLICSAVKNEIIRVLSNNLIGTRLIDGVVTTKFVTKGLLCDIQATTYLNQVKITQKS